MIALTTSEPVSPAEDIAASDQSAQVGSSVRVSRSTHVSTSVSSLRATVSRELLATQQFHQLVGAHGRRRPAPHPADLPLGPGLAAGRPHDPQRPAVLDHLDLVTLVEVVLASELRGDGHLTLAVQSHARLPKQYYVI